MIRFSFLGPFSDGRPFLLCEPRRARGPPTPNLIEGGLHYRRITSPQNSRRWSPISFPQHFRIEHEHKLSGLSDAELQQRLLEAEEELAKAGITIDLKAKEVVALPSLQHARCRLLPCFGM